MALSTGSKILVNDISTALDGKQDILGYTPVKSVNGTLADSAGNVSLSVSASVTSVNGMTGAVRISQKATVTYSGQTITIKAPSGGTWFCIGVVAGYNNSTHAKSIVLNGIYKSGGSTVDSGTANMTITSVVNNVLCVRTA